MRYGLLGSMLPNLGVIIPFSSRGGDLLTLYTPDIQDAIQEIRKVLGEIPILASEQVSIIRVG